MLHCGAPVIANSSDNTTIFPCSQFHILFVPFEILMGMILTVAISVLRFYFPTHPRFAQSRTLFE